ncbi:MAG: ABC transporter ATP-binding protein [Trueperaceae bacterium]|nr:ABC transporter ATP-binding protein [Trueperaceae bacterium]
MSDPNYSVEAAKASYRNKRKEHVKRLRKQGEFDEDGEAFQKAFDWEITRRLLAYLLPYKVQLISALVLLVGYSIIVPIFPNLIRQAVDNHLLVGFDGSGTYILNDAERTTHVSGLFNIVLIYIALRLLNFGLRFGYTYLIAWLGQHIVYDIRKEMFAKIQRLHLGFFDRTPVGRLITRITGDVEAIQQMMQDGIVGLIADLGLVIGLTVYMFWINWQLAIVTLVVMPILFWTLNYLRSRIRDAYRAVRLRTSISTAYLAENLSGMKTIQLFNREDRNQRNFDRRNLDLLEANIEQMRWFSLFWPAVQISSAIATGLILYFSAYQIVGPGLSDTITIGTLIAFIQYSGMFFRPLQDLSDKYNILQAAMASGERIFSLLDTPEQIVNRPDPESFASKFRGEVQFANVSFAYQNEDWVLRDLNFTIQPGESVAFVGHTGAGKTTIISLVSRFYDVQKGSIKIDGKDVRDYDQVDLRRHVGIVLQDPFLFSGTIRSNITLNDDSIPMEQVIEAAKFVNAHQFIEKLPQGYNTPVRERGAGFSTGQKQLLAFARALVQNPDILLVLDEATANVDTETEELIQDALQKLMQGRTSIIIAHRLSTIQDVDRIMVLRKGKLIEQGNHFELLEQDGYYRKLYELQYQERAS